MAYEIPERRLGEPKHLRILTVGAGAAGLNLACQMERHMRAVDHIIYEKNPEVGGTWYENRYPGCACDIPSHNYQFTWEPNPDWNNFYSSAPEILEYFKRLAKKYDLYRFIKLSHQVVDAKWISSEVSQERKNEFKTDPDVYLRYCKEIEYKLNSCFKFIIKNSPEQKEATSPTYIRRGVSKTHPGNGYLEALTKENVPVVTDAISEIVPKGIKLTTGEVIHVDMFVCATGFDISFCPRYPISGTNGVQLGDQWKERPKGYMSLAVDNFPNHFMFLGPNAPIGHGSVLPILEQATKYIMQILHKCQTEGVKSVVAKRVAVEDFTRHIDEFMKRTAWSSHCRSWFKNGTINGPIVAVHPGSRIHWFHMLDGPRPEDFEWESFSPNRFAYLGNGFSMKEEGRDTAFYFDNPASGFERIRY